MPPGPVAASGHVGLGPRGQPVATASSQAGPEPRLTVSLAPAVSPPPSLAPKWANSLLTVSVPVAVAAPKAPERCCAGRQSG
ncbi:MAG: hypothetical protein LBG60_07400 [Bifidobacteriaceae bacterium]|jgi:hypothetical protein|nr:hypothetical protein [Bifidobacteriaceae bacterium]